MSEIAPNELYDWCKIPAAQLENHPQLKIPFRLCRDSVEMGAVMARELVEEILNHNQRQEITRAIIPCGPSCWYKPFTDLVTREKVSLKNLVVFHMDECLDWQGRELPRNHPYSFRGFMERYFYDPIETDLSVPLVPYQPRDLSGPVAVPAWAGTCPAAQSRNFSLRLFKLTWENPNGPQEVTAIELTSDPNRWSAPLVVAITVE